MKFCQKLLYSNLYSWLVSTRILEENTCLFTVFLKKVLWNVGAKWSHWQIIICQQALWLCPGAKNSLARFFQKVDFFLLVKGGPFHSVMLQSCCDFLGGLLTLSERNNKRLTSPKNCTQLIFKHIPELDQFYKIAMPGFNTKLVLSVDAIKHESQFHLKVNLAIFQVDPKPAAPINKACWYEIN